MSFGSYLREVRKQKGYGTAKEHFESLGGKEALGISLRHFQQIESGKYPPSEKLLCILFHRLPRAQRREMIKCFFESVLDGLPNREDLVEYLDQNLLPDSDTNSGTLWTGPQETKSTFYTEEQMRYLIENRDALRLQRKVLLEERVPLSQSRIPEKKLNELIGLNLVRVDNDWIYPANTLYVIPNYPAAGPRECELGSDFIRAQMDLYISREGSDNQYLGYALQFVKPDVARQVLHQMHSFVRWVQSYAVADPGPEDVPMIYVGFAKKLKPNEL